jgi:hypothetical protein
MGIKQEIEAKFSESTEHLFHVANILGSGIEPINPDLQRKLARDMACGLGQLGQAIQLHLNHIEQRLSALEASARKK